MEQTNQTSAQDYSQKISLREKLAFGCGDAACNIIWASVNTFMVFFYTDVVGIAAAVVGTILLIVRVFDGFVDIGAGILVDRTKTRFGKARPWVLWMAAPFGICTVLLFTVPNLGMTGKIIYASVTYFLINIIYSAINVPYGVLNSLITQDQYQRSVLNIFRMIMVIPATLVVVVGTQRFVATLGNGPKAWQTVYIIYAVLAVVFFMITFFGTNERVKSAIEDKSHANVPIKSGIKALFTNKYWVIIVLLITIFFVGNGLGTGIAIYYAQYIMGDPGLISIIMVATLIPSLICMALISPLVKKYGKRNCSMVGGGLSILGSIIIMINSADLTFIIAGLALRGLGIAPLTATLFAMVADTIEYGEWKSGFRIEGLVYSAASLGTKIGSGIGSALVGWMLAWGGYVGGAAWQSASALFFIKVAFIHAPIVLAILLLILLWLYTLDQKYPKIIKELYKRSLEQQGAVK